jgi:hypothetical protein
LSSKWIVVHVEAFHSEYSCNGMAYLSRLNVISQRKTRSVQRKVFG